MTQISPHYPSIDSTIYTRENAEKAMQLVEETQLKALDADTFNKLKDLADNMEVDPNSKIQGPLKSMLSTVAMVGLSALAASAFSGRILAFVSKNTKVMDKFSKALMNLLKNAKKYVKNNPASKAGKLKGVMIKSFDKALKFIEKYSKAGIEESLKGISGKGSVAKKAALQGRNIIEKTTKGATAAIVGGKTLYESTADRDKDGIADISQKGANKDKELAKAVIDAVVSTAA